MTRDEDHLTSDITDCLVAMLQQRDAMGRAKYGKTLDRDDLTPEQWAQHMAEELLDGAGYALAYAREVAKMRAGLDACQEEFTKTARETIDLARQTGELSASVHSTRGKIARLDAERDSLLTAREVLKRECEALKAERSELVDDVEAMQQTNNDLAAENERLRAAMERLIEAAGDSDDARYGTLATVFVREIARAALNATTGEGHE